MRKPRYSPLILRGLGTSAALLWFVLCGTADDRIASAAYLPAGRAGPSHAVASAAPHWSARALSGLLEWAAAAPEDALPPPDTRALRQAMARGDRARTESAARALALTLARLHLLGWANSGDRHDWAIVDTDADLDLDKELDGALARNDIDGFFISLRPSHPEYTALRAAYGRERDPARRLTIARNMERWRWMPLALEHAYILVNEPAFEASLWRDGRRERTWRAIVGKTSTPSPVFAAEVSGVILNPSWSVPDSIARESGGFSRRRGFVRIGQRWSQRPGAGNALGRMKLIMPNSYNVYLHDTPGKGLFGSDLRAYSHGCIRVDDALDFASALLSGTATRGQIDTLVARGSTTSLALPQGLPVYISYFTAGTKGDGTFAVMPDIYGRDPGIRPRLPAAATGPAI